MMTTTTGLIIANFVIAFTFLVVALATIWLLAHRYRDWPKSWVLLLVGLAMGSCAVARFVHAMTYLYWPRIDPMGMAVADAFSATFGLIAVGFVPWGVYEIRKLATPKEYEAQVRKTNDSEWQAKFAQSMLERKDRQVRAMKAMISDIAAMNPEIKARILEIVEEM